MNIQKLREEFEKLPEIASKLDVVSYNEQFNSYHPAMINSAPSVKYVQGAWYALQEQQKIIDKLIKSNIVISEQLDRFKKELLK